MDYNNIVLIWRCTQEPEFKTKWDFKVANFPIVTNKKYKTKDWEEVEKSCFLPVVAYNGLATIASEYMKKWSRISVAWEIEQQRWEDNEWNKRSSFRIIANNIILLDSKKTSESREQKDEFHESDRKHGINQNEGISIDDIPF